ncbi:hypothetical protein [Candidatus Nitrosacidococcus sp. I8]|uniref:hypothetical protein n=1 Tax=Candidatus Nitrosacidococcus sp. I8 TaxID=2942908 RepID=UPI0022280976|nr:hypothetical protein [Candidatus Nitrosacidococcus sp. I8]CAH9015064.1 hypothetical protein NURINAE_00137 [Candidatus Nitrosacidococcus sp. I8]
MTSSTVITDADYKMRNWSDPKPGSIRLGSDTHKEMFCSLLLETHNPYKPAVMDWPRLSDKELKRVASLPIWDIAIQTEGRASLRVATYAKTINDLTLRAALDMDAAEEKRHKEVLSRLAKFYNVTIAYEPHYMVPKNPEWAWMVTGYSECIDSFFAFGLFESAKRSGFFPTALTDTFEPVIQEEARHILFFVNWVVWYKRNLKIWQKPWFFTRILAVWVFLIWERVGLAKGLDKNKELRDANFAITGAEQIGVEIQLVDLLEICLSENERRLSGYDQRLVRPTIVPFFIRMICSTIGVINKVRR